MNLESESEITYQQSVVYDRLNENWRTIINANDSLGAKASVLAGGSGAAFAVAGLAYSSTVGVPMWCLIVISGLVCVSTLIANAIWSAADSCLLGASDGHDLYDSYINVDEDTCYSQLIADLEAGIGVEVDRNVLISKRLTWLTYLLDLQIVILITGWLI